jgi:hypothetical protein
MQAQPVLEENALGQHSGLNCVVAKKSNSPSGSGMGCLGRFKIA